MSSNHSQRSNQLSRWALLTSTAALTLFSVTTVSAASGDFVLTTDSIDIENSTATGEIDTTLVPPGADSELGHALLIEGASSDTRSITLVEGRAINLSSSDPNAFPGYLYGIFAGGDDGVAKDIDVTITQMADVTISHASAFPSENPDGDAFGIVVSLADEDYDDNGELLENTGDVTIAAENIVVSSSTHDAYGIEVRTAAGNVDIDVKDLTATASAPETSGVGLFALTDEGEVDVEVGRITVSGFSETPEDGGLEASFGVGIDASDLASIKIAGDVTATDPHGAAGAIAVSQDGVALIEMGSADAAANLIVHGDGSGASTDAGMGLLAIGGSGASIHMFGNTTFSADAGLDPLADDINPEPAIAALLSSTSTGNADVIVDGNILSNATGILAITGGNGDAYVKVDGDVTADTEAVGAIVGFDLFGSIEDLPDQDALWNSIQEAQGDAVIDITGSVTTTNEMSYIDAIVAGTPNGAAIINVSGDDAHVTNNGDGGSALIAISGNASGTFEDGEDKKAGINAAADLTAANHGALAWALNGDASADTTGDITAGGLGAAAISDAIEYEQGTGNAFAKAEGTVTIDGQGELGEWLIDEDLNDATLSDTKTYTGAVFAMANDGDATAVLKGNATIQENTKSFTDWYAGDPTPPLPEHSKRTFGVVAQTTNGNATATVDGDGSLDGLSVVVNGAGSIGVYAGSENGTDNSAYISVTGGVGTQGDGTTAIAAYAMGDAVVENGKETAGSSIVVNGTGEDGGTGLVAVGHQTARIDHIGDITINATQGIWSPEITNLDDTTEFEQPSGMPSNLFDALQAVSDFDMPQNNAALAMAVEGASVLNLSGNVKTNYQTGGSVLKNISFGSNTTSSFKGSIGATDGGSFGGGGLLTLATESDALATSTMELVGASVLGELLFQTVALGDTGTAKTTVEGSGSADITGSTIGEVIGQNAKLFIEDSVSLVHSASDPEAGDYAFLVGEDFGGYQSDEPSSAQFDIGSELFGFTGTLDAGNLDGLANVKADRVDVYVNLAADGEITGETLLLATADPDSTDSKVVMDLRGSATGDLDLANTEDGITIYDGGTYSGNMVLGSKADEVVVLSGGMLTGNVEFGTGDDEFEAAIGSFSGIIDGGNDHDEAELWGTGSADLSKLVNFETLNIDEDSDATLTGNFSGDLIVEENAKVSIENDLAGVPVNIYWKLEEGAEVSGTDLLTVSALDTATNNEVVIDSDGTLSGAITLQDTKDRLRFLANSVTTGDLSTGNREDFVELLNGAQFSGNIDLGDDNDTFEAALGSYSGTVDGGVGTDSALLSMTGTADFTKLMGFESITFEENAVAQLVGDTTASLTVRNGAFVTLEDDTAAGATDVAGTLKILEDNLTVTGDFTLGEDATLQTEFDEQAEVGQIIASGDAILEDGATIKVGGFDTGLTDGASYTVISANSLTDEGAVLADDFAFFDFIKNATAPDNEFAIIADRTLIIQDEDTGGANTEGLAEVLDDLAVSPETNADPEVQAFLNELEDALTSEGAVKADIIEDLLGNDVVYAAEGATIASNQMMLSVETRLSSLDTFNRTAVFAKDSGLDYGLWAQPFTTRSKQDAVGTVDGYELSSSGFAAGADMSMSSNLTAGVAVSYSQSSVKGTGNASGDVTDIANTQVAGYLRGTSDRYYGEVIVAASQQSYDGVRLSMGDTFTSDYDGSQIALRGTAGAYVNVSDSVQLRPEVQYQVASLKVDAYKENQATGVGMDEYKDTTSQVVVGSYLATQLSGEGYSMVPELGVFYVRDSERNTVTTSRFNFGGNAFTSEGLVRDRNGLLLRGIWTSYIGENSSLKFTYDGDFRDSSKSHTGAITFRWEG